MINCFTFLASSSGRNNTGAITVRHRVRPKNRSCYVYNYNFKNYNISNFRIFGQFKSSYTFVELNVDGNYTFIFAKNRALPRILYEYKPGSFVSNVETSPKSGPKYARSQFSRALVMKRYGTNIVLRGPSGELRKFKAFCMAYPSANTGFIKQNTFLRKAGTAYNLGRRPYVRGCAINPVDHPHGGRTGDSRPSVSPWAILTKGYRTRFKSYNKKIVLQSVQSIKDKKRTKRVK